MENLSYCQSCGMPITGAELQGTNSDGALTEDYCTYCYQQGSFVQNVSMEEMIEACVPHMISSGMEEARARDLLEKTLPTLTRWKK